MEALLLTSEEATKRFKARLAGLKRRRKHIDRRAVPDLALQPEPILATLHEGVDDPRAGFELKGGLHVIVRSSNGVTTRAG
ncbi:hypothetical protein LR032_04550 [Candidatus Bipolaricaulota bacterium]|nr:hypothetical protein [Candidatus Bipolaricaulota bacterium]